MMQLVNRVLVGRVHLLIPLESTPLALLVFFLWCFLQVV
jgi:hypothetical protein